MTKNKNVGFKSVCCKKNFDLITTNHKSQINTLHYKSARKEEAVIDLTNLQINYDGLLATANESIKLAEDNRPEGNELLIKAGNLI